MRVSEYSYYKDRKLITLIPCNGRRREREKRMRRANQLRNAYPRSFIAATSEKSKAPEGAAEMVPKEALGTRERIPDEWG